MAKERVLIAVKTYPTLSQKYAELVCTAGFKQDGSWIRIYPSPFRFLTDSQRYRKYQWIELELAKNARDPRPESYSPVNIDDITLGKLVGTEHGWASRKELIFSSNKIYENLETIIAGAKSNKFSLVIFKAARILDFIVEATESDWEIGKLEAARAALGSGLID
ncbi:hypothetical protein [Pararhizobium sp. IMCC21322]|uniref:hypothetical protein n=1 Tax=Pararhizobium sp. IMCC21322 TaxID=3067903 RepID=UPI0027417D85|nr:hypothetical protein [Pararhizobium sp. IMCC21322]